MAERRRRRHLEADEILSEGNSQQSQLSLSDSNCDSEDFYETSEYDSTEDVDADDGVVTKSEVEKKIICVENVNIDDKIDNSADGCGNDDNLRRESGDEKFVNDQENKLENKPSKIAGDKSSPFFIPTKGNFYQHDIRSDNSNSSRRGAIRGVCKDFSKDRWMHDRYIEEEQAPKTRAELIEVYGYDIRSQKSKDVGSVQSHGRYRRRPGVGQRSCIELQKREKQHSNCSGSNMKATYACRKKTVPINVHSRDFHAKKRFLPQKKFPVKLDDTSEIVSSEANLQNKTTFEKGKQLEESCSSGNPCQRQDKIDNFPAILGSVLDVINNKELEGATRLKMNERSNLQKRHANQWDENLSERMKNISFTKEPKRYSSLRQRTAEPVVKSSYTPHQLCSFPPSQLTVSQPTSSISSPVAGSSTNKTVKEGSFWNNSVVDAAMTNETSQYSTTSLDCSQELQKNPRNMITDEVANTATTNPDDAALAQLQWYEATLAYQQAVLSHFSPSSISHSHHEPVGQSVGDVSLLMNNEPHATSPPLLPSLPSSTGQGNIGMPIFPPVLPHNLQSSNFVQRNLLPERAVVPHSMPVGFPQTPNLIAQQVGGVTYYPNPLQPMQSVVPGNTPIGSPMRRLNSAIPIKHPME